MKGIVHFATGIAIATCFPDVVQRAAEGSLLPVLAGLAGVLPDTLDFKFVRYFERYDDEIDPGPEPDPREIAERVAAAMRRVYETGRSQSIMLHTVRLGADLWRQYAIRFDPERDEVAVRIGPVVDTGQVPVPGSRRRDADEVRVKVGVPMGMTYDAESKIDIFSGPSFRFERRGGQIHIHFLDWHRRWSHSLTLASVLGLGAAAAAALVEFVSRGAPTSAPLLTGLVVGLGLAGHVLLDQLGHTGSNLLYPWTRGRTAGLGLLRSGDALPNFLAVSTAVTLTLFNLDRFSAHPWLDPRWSVGLALALPVVALGSAYLWQRRRGARATDESLRQPDIVSEMEEVQIG